MGKLRNMKINGLPVTDASKPLTIKITAGDCKKGATKEPNSCAAAQAALRQTTASEARVHISRTYLKFGKKWVRYQTPAALRQEIVSFDKGTGFSPGEYLLRAIPPSELAQRGGRQGGQDKPRKGPKRHRAKSHMLKDARHRPHPEF